MAIKYSADKGGLYKDCNCGGPIPTFEKVFFRPGKNAVQDQASFTAMIRQRRRDEREYSGEELIAWKKRTAEMRQERKEQMREFARQGFTAGLVYFAEAKTVELLAKDTHITVIPEDEYDTLEGSTFRQHFPKPTRRRY